MTIGAGFITGDAVILCADSQEVISEYAKTSTQKIYTCTFSNNWRVGILGAADDATYIELFQEEFVRQISPGPLDYSKTVEKINGIIHEIHKDHIWPLQRDDRPSFQTLIALQGINPSLRALLVTRNSVVLPVHEFQTIGVGSYLADYLFSRIYPRGEIYNAKTEEVIRAVIFVLNQVKSTIQGCDGETHAVVFNGVDGTQRIMVGAEVREIELEFDQFDLAQRDIFRAIAHPEMNSEEFGNRLRAFDTRLLDLRGRQQIFLEMRSNAIKEFEKNQQAARANRARSRAKASQKSKPIL